jgi:hypothetical protein
MWDDEEDLLRLHTPYRRGIPRGCRRSVTLLILVRVLGTSWSKGVWHVFWWQQCLRPPTIRFA